MMSFFPDKSYSFISVFLFEQDIQKASRIKICIEFFMSVSEWF